VQRASLHILALWFALSAAALAQSAQVWCPPTGATYGVSLKRAAEHVAHVDVVAHTPAGEFQLPVWNALYIVRDFSQFMTHVQATGGVPQWMCEHCDLSGAQVLALDKTTWRVDVESEHPCVTFSYDIFLDEAGPFGAQLDARHAFLNWAQVLVYRPEHRNEPLTVKLLDVPAGWHLRDTGLFGGLTPEDAQHAQAEAITYDRLVDSPVELGAFSETQFQQNDATYHIAVDGDPADYDMMAVRGMLQKVTTAGVDWMQDHPYDDYTFIYHFPRGPAGGGMEHAFGTAIDVSAERLQRDPLALPAVSAHEFFHLWNVKRIRPRSLEPIDYTKEQYSRILWFSEGVTSTVAEHLLVRAGLADERKFLQRLASQIAQLNARSARNWQSVEESSLTTWFDKYPFYAAPQRSISYYNKGQIVGVLLDLEMRRATNGRRSLRDLFQYMNERWAKQGEYFDDSEGVRLAAEVLTGNDFREFFKRYVSGTDEIPYDDFFRTVGLRLVHRQGSATNIGFGTARLRNGVAMITRVDPGSVAEQQGIVPGDTVLELEGHPLTGEFNTLLQHHQAGETVHLKLRSSGQERELDLPLGSRKFDDYSIEDASQPTAVEMQRRAAWIRGDSETGAQ
jgi:predicted metalloprotease with PDZ domain